MGNFRIAWRLLWREPAYSLIAVLGLSLGFAACFLLLGFVDYCFDYEAQVPDAARVYLVKQRFNLFAPPIWTNSIQLPVRDLAERSGLASAVSIVHTIDARARIGERTSQVALSAVDSDFLTIFGIEAQAGDVRASLRQPDAIALTAQAATRLFGQIDVLGRTLRINGQDYTVAALLPDPPANTTEPYEALVGVGSSAWPQAERAADRGNWHQNVGRLYVKLAVRVQAAQLQTVLQDGVDRFGMFSIEPSAVLQKLAGQKAEDMRLLPVRDGYFDADLKGRGQRGNKPAVLGLAAVAVLILGLATSNYINLSIMRTVRRRREIGLRKSLGAGARQLIAQLLVESMLVALLALALGLTLAWLVLPLFGELLDRKLDGIFTPMHLSLGAILGLAVGALACAYPATIALRTRIADSIGGRGTDEAPGGLWLRRVLSIGQFAIAIVLVALCVCIAWQVHFSSHVNPGFDPASLLLIDLPHDLNTAQDRALLDQLRRIPGIDGVAASSNAPASNASKISAQIDDRNGVPVNMGVQFVSPDYFEVYHVKPSLGRLFDARIDQADTSQVAVLDLQATRLLGYRTPEEALGQAIDWSKDEHLRIIGVAPELQHQDTHEHGQAVMYKLSRQTPILTMRVSGSMAYAEEAIALLWRRHFPDELPQIRSVSAALAENYADDARLVKLLSIASALAAAIAAFGIYVLSAHVVLRRTGEIIVRKLYGAGRADILALLAKEMGALLAASAVIAAPLAALGMERYLSDFALRAPMGLWPLAGAVCVTVILAMAAVARHVLAALRIAPVTALRN